MNKKDIIQFVKFAAVGLSNTLVNYIVYVIFISLGAHYVIANTLGFLISVLNAYFWGCRFVFKEDETKEKRVWWKVLLKTYAAYALGFVINTVLLALWIDVLNIGQYLGFVGSVIGGMSKVLAFLPAQMTAKDISELAGPVINIVVTVPINFVINKFWAYKQKNKPENAKV